MFEFTNLRRWKKTCCKTIVRSRGKGCWNAIRQNSVWTSSIPTRGFPNSLTGRKTGLQTTIFHRQWQVVGNSMIVWSDHQIPSQHRCHHRRRALSARSSRALVFLQQCYSASFNLWMCRSHSRPFWADWLMSSANMDEEGKFCIRCPNRGENLKLSVKAVKLSQLSRCSWQFEATALLWGEETAGCLKLDWLAIHNGTSIFVQGRWLNSVLNMNTKSCKTLV